MSRIVVCDTGPLIHLSEAGALEFLEHAGVVLIPPVVETEFVRNTAGLLLPAWIKILPVGRSVAAQAQKWISTDIDAGETQAIGLAIQEKVKNLQGGINAWAKEVDHELPVY